MRSKLYAFSGTAALLAITGVALAQINARMLRQPDVSETEIAFVYAGDIWVVPKAGGNAQRLSSPDGEEQFPRFSPDGTQLAYSANYDGTSDIYVVDHRGGIPARVTHHPMDDRILDWYPDGRSLLFASSMESGRQRFRQFYKVSAQGGLPEKLPVPYGEFGSVSPDGQQLAYIPISRDFRTWKRYRGGMAPDILVFNLESFDFRNVTENDASDSSPMWHGKKIYYLSDAGPNKRHNLWVYDTLVGSREQVTNFADFDIHFPAIGPSEIVFEAGGKLYLLNLSNHRTVEVPVKAVTDQRTLKPRTVVVEKAIASAGISPTGKRAVFEARGEVFTVPAEHGLIRNLTNHSGSAERHPSWSPDGSLVAYWSDRSGEYELVLRKADGSGEEEKVTSLGPGYRYGLFWSPDSKKLAFIDQAMRIQYFDRDSKEVKQIDQGLWMFHGALEDFRVNWSSDSRWITYARGGKNRTRSIYLYDLNSAKLHQATSGYYDTARPVFDPEGKYLYFLTSQSFTPSYSDFDNSWIYGNSTQIAAVPLKADTPSPLSPRNDEEEVKKSEKAGDEKKEEAGAEDKEDAESSVAESKSEDSEEAKDKKTEEDKAKAVEIDLDGFEQRIVILPPAAGNYGGLAAAAGKVIFQRDPRLGEPSQASSALVYFDLKEREEKEVIAGIRGFELSADQKKVLVVQNGKFAIIDLQPKQKIEKPLKVSELQMVVDPKQEWRQIFNDAWRFERDFFYDPNMHGVDWNAMRVQYGQLLEDAVTRWDVNYVLGELIAELNASHTYRGGGDSESAEERRVGLLGIDWALENGAYRVKRIIRGAKWDAEARSPLDQPGIEVSEGDYILGVNGIAIDVAKDPWAAFEGLDGKTISLTINSEPSMEGAREVLVETTDSETRLRHLEWIESNRKRVEEATHGRVGYVYVRSTGIDGQSELARQFYAQFTKDALIIDERFNSGGQIPDRFIELLNREPLSRWAVRDGIDWQWPPVAHFGPKVMLINGWSGSGGDAFPYYFREAGLGPLIGTKTWGGLIGISGAPALVDGGTVTVPTFRMYGVKGDWFAEGQGVSPDIEVKEDPTALARGTDPQLERAIAEAVRALDAGGSVAPKRPPYEDRSH